jgi:ArsR family transcriptional regulator, cadmium/lead-responsive transcriptional repressor
MIKITQLQLESKLFKGFGDPSRLAIIEAIAEKPLTVSEIVEITRLSQPNVSMHLACLLECGLVQNEKDGRNSYYQVSGDEVKQIIKIAQKIINKHSTELYDCTRY